MAKFALDLAQIAVKVEAVEGTAEALTNAEATIQPRDGGTFWEPDIPFHTRDVVSGTHESFSGVAGGPRTAGITFDVPLYGGTAGVAPSWGILLQAMGFSENIVGGTSVTYLPAINPSSYTMAAYIDGQRFLINGARARGGIMLPNGGIPMLHVEMMGGYNVPTDTALLSSISYETTDPVAVSGGAVTLDSVDFGWSDLKFDFDNELGVRHKSSNANSMLSYAMTKQALTGAIDPEWELVATYDFMTKMTGNSEGPFSLVNGSGAGQIMTFTAPKIQYSEIKPGDREGYLTAGIALQLNRSSGGDSFSLAIT